MFDVINHVEYFVDVAEYASYWSRLMDHEDDQKSLQQMIENVKSKIKRHDKPFVTVWSYVTQKEYVGDNVVEIMVEAKLGDYIDRLSALGFYGHMTTIACSNQVAYYRNVDEFNRLNSQTDKIDISRYAKKPIWEIYDRASFTKYRGHNLRKLLLDIGMNSQYREIIKIKKAA